MLLKNLKLNNIRTYKNSEIEFPSSSLMLSGDIGSGKSSILLAVEFALFGILRGELSGDSLLRNGEDEGSVELTFNLGKDYTIKRTLRRTSKGIQQSSGYIIEDGAKTEGTAIELKTKILDILGYPQSLLTTSKSLVYRYTVYTPQEEMKRIIQEDSEVRLDILRKVFNMDKYKRIKENAHTYLVALKDDILIDETKCSQLNDKEKELNHLNAILRDCDEEMKLLLPKEEEIKNKKKDKLREISDVEEAINYLNKIKQRFSTVESDSRNLVSKLNSNLFKLKDMKDKKEKLQTELEGMSTENEEELKLKIEALTKSISVLEQKHFQITGRVLSIKEKIKDSENMIKKISDLKHCPTCYQDVNDGHKDKLLDDENKKIEESNKEIEELSKEKPDVASKKEQLESFKTNLHKIDLIKFKRKQLSEYNLNLMELEKENEELKKQNAVLINEKEELENKIKDNSNIEEKNTVLKAHLSQIQDEEKRLHGKISEYKTKKESFSLNSTKLKTEISFLKELQTELKKKKDLRDWIRDHFLNVVDTIEKHVMLKIQQQFNLLFKEWFNFMLEDENMNARLDEKFTPIIEQNGYEIDFSNLSGGEKTSVALAYRLALTKVINDIVSTVKTKDIIVLDEPTDGFSSEQLDKLKDVLDELNMKQIIIVSHESKVESFVERVVRVNKNEGVSEIL